MATVTFDKINNELNQIVSDFEKLIDKGHYDDAIEIINGITRELTVNDGIELDQTSQNGQYDNRFHEIFSLLMDKIDSRKNTHAQPSSISTQDYNALKLVLENASERIFKTAEIRKNLMSKDPNQDAYREALKDGITEATNDKIYYKKRKRNMIL